MTRRVLSTLFVTVTVFALVVRADDPVKIKTPTGASQPSRPGGEDKLDPKSTLDDAAFRQAQLAHQFLDLQAAVLRLAQSLENGNAEDKEKAALLKKALEKIAAEGIDSKFNKLVDLLRSPKGLNLDDLEKAKNTNRELSEDIRKILAIIINGPQSLDTKEEQGRIERQIAELKELIRIEQNVRAKTEGNKTDNPTLKKSQADNAQATEALARSMSKDGQEGKSGKPGEAKSEGKPGEGKGEIKNDTKEAKGTDKEGSKDAGSDAKDPKGEGAQGSKSDAKGSKSDAKGDPKDAKGDVKGEGAKGDPKDAKSDAKGAGPQSDKDGKAGSKSEGKPSDAKAGSKGASKGEGAQGSQSDGKSGDQAANKGDKKEDGPNSDKGSKILSKPEGNKPADPKDANKAEAKGEGAKPGSPSGNKSDSKGKSDGKAEAKGQPSQQQGNPSSGQQGQSKGQGQQGQQQPSGSKSNGQQQPNNGDDQQQANQKQPGRQQIQDAPSTWRRPLRNWTRMTRKKHPGR